VSRQLERPSSALILWGREVRPLITGNPEKRKMVERESEGVVVVTTDGTRDDRHDPARPGAQAPHDLRRRRRRRARFSWRRVKVMSLEVVRPG
jgi:hypothetical protein